MYSIRRTALRLLLIVATLHGCGDNPTESDPQCDHLRPSGWYLLDGDSVVAWQWEGSTGGGITLTDSDEIGPLSLLMLDEDSLEIRIEEECDHELRWFIDDDIAAFAPVSNELQQVVIEGLSPGASTFQFQVWHAGSHSDYDSDPVPITVTSATSFVPLGVDAMSVTHHSSDVAYWNYDLTNGPGDVEGAIIVAEGDTLTDVVIHFLDTVLIEHGMRRRVIPTDDAYHLEWSILDGATANIESVPGERWNVRVLGHSPGNTRVTFRLMYNQTVELESGPIPIIVRPARASEQDRPSFRVLLNGWRIIVRDGQLVTFDSVCNRSVPATLEASVGTLTALYSLRLLDDECKSEVPSLNLYRLAFYFESGGIARVLNHPIHDGEHFVFHILGLGEGSTTMRIHLVRVDHVVEWSSPPIPVDITL